MKVSVYCTIGALVKHYARFTLFLAGSLLLAGCRGLGEAAPPPAPVVVAGPVKAPQPAPAALAAADLRLLSTEEQLSRVITPMRDARELRLATSPELDEIPLAVNATAPDYPVGTVRSFSVLNVSDLTVRTIEAELLYRTDVAYAWVESGQPADESMIREAVDYFSEVSYPRVRSVFGSEWSPGVDGDPRVHILHTTGMGSSVAGYYSSSDEFSRLANPNSNEQEMFYINLAWLNSQQNPQEYEQVLSHEFQHMIHWNMDRGEETWLNEGFSEYATLVAGFPADLGFISSFAAAPDLQLNAWGDNTGGSGAHYGASFLFAIYLAERFGDSFISQVVAEPANGVVAIERVLEQTGAGLTFDELFADWVVANFVDQPGEGAAGQFGYDRIDVPALRENDLFSALPAPASERLVGNYATDYYRIEGDEAVQIAFAGDATARLVVAEPRSGDYAAWSNRGDDMSTHLTGQIDLSTLPPGTPVTMTADLWVDIEQGYDYGYVMASRDGVKWTILPGQWTTTDNPAGNALGPGYSGTSGSENGAPVWRTDSFDLSEFAGEAIQVRFQYVADDAISQPGFLVDNIAIPAVDYRVDFEGDLSGWVSEGWLISDLQLPQRWIVQLLLLDGEELMAMLPVPVAEDGMAAITSDWLTAGKSIILAVSGATRATTEPAAYRFSIERAP
jgi:hypothetical protein